MVILIMAICLIIVLFFYALIRAGADADRRMEQIEFKGKGADCGFADMEEGTGEK